MSFEHDQFNQGLELAYTLNDVMEMNRHYKDFVLRGEHDSELNTEIDNVIVSLEKIGAENVLASPRLTAPVTRDTLISQPYLDLLKNAEELFFGKYHADEPGEAAIWITGEDAVSAGERLEAGLMAAVDSLIARDIYIQGMNPHEVKEGRPVTPEELVSVGVRPRVAAEVIRRVSIDIEPPEVVADITDEEIASGL